jgi:hypothetical protein
MKKYWNTFFALIFIALYLSPVLELDTEECKANYSNECHQYINPQNEQVSIVAKEIKQPVQQEFDLLFQSVLSFKPTTLVFTFLSIEPWIARIFLLNSTLLI